MTGCPGACAPPGKLDGGGPGRSKDEAESNRLAFDRLLDGELDAAASARWRRRWRKISELNRRAQALATAPCVAAAFDDVRARACTGAPAAATLAKRRRRPRRRRSCTPEPRRASERAGTRGACLARCPSRHRVQLWVTRTRDICATLAARAHHGAGAAQRLQAASFELARQMVRAITNFCRGPRRSAWSTAPPTPRARPRAS